MSEIMDRAAERELYTDEAPVEVNASTSNVVIVDNVPKTEMNRYEKLISVIRKIFSSYGTIIDEGLYIPVEGEAGKEKTCGFAFIEYENADMATRAVMEGNGKRLDNAHTLLVNHYDDFEKFSKVPAEYVPPKISDYESKVNLNSWLLDGRDMFVVRYQHETQIFFNDPFKRANDYGRQYKYGGEREKAQDKHWCDRYVEWSARGSYLATFHDPGIVVWGGENFERLGRFPHQGVECIQFSPSEKYLITCNWAESKPDKPAEVSTWKTIPINGYSFFLSFHDTLLPLFGVHDDTILGHLLVIRVTPFIISKHMYGGAYSEITTDNPIFHSLL